MLIAGAVGDFAMYKELRKYPRNAIVQDLSQITKAVCLYNKEKGRPVK